MKELPERIHDDTNGLDYVLVGDYYIPALRLTEESRPIGHWGRRRKAYLEEARPALYCSLLLSGKLVIRFQFLRHALGGFHLLHDKVKPLLCLLVHVGKVRPEFPGQQQAACGHGQQWGFFKYTGKGDALIFWKARVIYAKYPADGNALRIDQFRINNFFRPAAYAVHMLHPRKLVPGFQFLRHALGGFHLLHDKGKPFLHLFFPRHELPKVGKGYAILVREEFSCLINSHEQGHEQVACRLRKGSCRSCRLWYRRWPCKWLLAGSVTVK